jgi:hypothetical protein
LSRLYGNPVDSPPHDLCLALDSPVQPPSARPPASCRAAATPPPRLASPSSYSSSPEPQQSVRGNEIWFKHCCFVCLPLHLLRHPHHLQQQWRLSRGGSGTTPCCRGCSPGALLPSLTSKRCSLLSPTGTPVPTYAMMLATLLAL